jgi:hypothetical protein
MSVDLTASAPRVIDEAFLKGVANDDPECVAHVSPAAERAHFDIEVISNPHVDYDGTALEDDLAGAFLDRYRRLREPFGEQVPRLVVVRGAAKIEAEPEATHELDADAETRVWETAIGRLAERSPVLTAPDDATSTDEIAAVFVVDPRPADRPGDPLAVIAIVAMPAGLEAGETPPGTRQLIRILAEGPARNAPLHVIAVSGQDEIDGDFLARCQQLRMGLVLAGPNDRNDVVTLSRTAMRRGQSATEVAVVPCPGFEPGRGTPGLTRIRIDADSGDAAIAFRHDLGSDRPHEPVQIARPLPSASRVSSSERRLYGRVRELIQAGASASQDAERLAAYESHVEETWANTGYAALCADDGDLPLPVTRHTTYNLLLLLRKRGDRYDLLLSNHSPQRRSPLSDWNTLLMPAFRGVRELLEHLRDDVIRQATERAEDFERAAHAELFEQAVNRILLGDGRVGDDLWIDQLREVDSRTIRKVSPTTGAITEFKYHLVTLLPLIDRSIAKPLEGDAEQDLRRRDRHQIIEWLRQLDTVRVADDDLGAARGVPIEAFEAGGTGLRWDPETSLDERGPDAAARRRGTRAYPGAIWFPLPEPGEDPLWTRCPAIMARNRDVMKWVGDRIGSLRKANEGQPPDQIVLGRYATGSDQYDVERVYPFERDADAPEDENAEDDVPARSTTEALAKVRFNDAFDLGDELAYPDASFRRVWLQRRPVPDSTGREAIYVYPGEAGECFGDAVTERVPLGRLRPVQRYVLQPGLERVEALDAAVRARLGEDGDRWGFVRVRKGGALKPVSVTPPIVEQLHPDDQERDGGGTDFVVCDGNHRIVRGVWMSGKSGEPGEAVPAVAVLAAPGAEGLPQPYYARPFGALEWGATAGNVLVVSPDAASKYLVREVTDADLLERYGDRKHQLYRRYFRNLETGFGSLGGQGGRWVGG